ncbi:glycoside hydrolase family 3 C-terminal domain-containing protein [Flavobacterium frigidarium]|uniref:glycoside hydrolase family 3 C-terminal domain-containing protein n=1 Tax=Flavobacterium frigidarium TaxID=99286 RepID=UPI0003FAF8D4|nr:glycoside hydrolase family 3 C-terminal domain-containing protein [Flavobacterium frigidarium]
MSQIKQICIFFFLAITVCDAQVAVHKDASKTFEERASFLVSKMTLQEKVSQMTYNSAAIDRLEIPEMNWWNECLHGVARAGIATVFPQGIGMSAMFDRKQMFEIANAISDEARAKHHDFVSKNKRGIHQGLTFWTPNINIFRDPRWGRGMETYGEDPYLTGELGVQFIKGLQGNDPKYYKLIATAKHFVVHSGPEASRHSFNVDPSAFDMLNTYSPQFEKVVKESGVYSVMCAYNSYKGVPCCGNKELSSLLRKDWGFKGYIVSDCWAVTDFYNKGAHEVVQTKEQASAMAVQAGTDLNCGDSYPSLVKAVEQGLITEAELTISVERLVEARLKLGLFAPKGDVKYEDIPYSVVDSEVHRLLALQSARKSMVLLKNNNLLPLSKNLKKVAVIGPNANDADVLLGNYNGFPSQPVTPLQGIMNKLPNAQVSFAEGCRLADGLPILEAVPAAVLYSDSKLKNKGLKAEYFSNTTLKGKASHKQVDANVDFLWATTPPFADMSYDKYSVRWTGYLSVPKSGRYALGGQSYSGMKLFVDGKLIVESENVYEPKTEYEYLDLEANKVYKIKLEYKQDNSEHAVMRFLWEAPNENLEKEAMALAEASDVVVFCMGLSPLLEGEEMKVKVDGFAGGDRLDIKLPASQTNLMKRISTLGKPMVLVLLNGSALAINWENENIPAILEAWYPGQAGGTAIADILFGDYNPSGRLPLTFYKDIKDIPAFDDYNMKGKTYRYFQGKPLYEFGFGLSYTSFKYSNLVLDKEQATNKEILLSIDVTNTGKVDGDEVTELYMKSAKEDFQNTIRTLVGFERTFLKAGETKTVHFKVQPKQLAQINADVKMEVNPGDYTFSVGGAQPNEERIKTANVVVSTVALKGNPFQIQN